MAKDNHTDEIWQGIVAARQEFSKLRNDLWQVGIAHNNLVYSLNGWNELAAPRDSRLLAFHILDEQFSQALSTAQMYAGLLRTMAECRAREIEGE
ncbi:MAG: hypothetical protein Q7O66_02020 [Dehalococcoidia bacterium]|nr:hypothetical protein [Dehalococcoidia bacterium]